MFSKPVPVKLLKPTTCTVSNAHHIASHPASEVKLFSTTIAYSLEYSLLLLLLLL